MTTQQQYAPTEYSQQVPPYINDLGQGHADLVRIALNSIDLMDDLKMNLLALEWNPIEKKLIKRNDVRPLINETGAQKVITIVSSIVNRNSHLSNIDIIEINRICREIELNINKNFFDNWEQYWMDEWEAESNWSNVRMMAGNYAKLALLRAKDGIERNILVGNTKTFINKSEVDSSQKITEVPQRKFNFFK